MRRNGFTLVELTVAMASVLVLLLGTSAMVGFVIDGSQKADGKLGASEQRAELKNAFFSLTNQNQSKKCASLFQNVKFKPGYPADPSLQFDIPTNGLSDIQTDWANIDRFYLTGASFVRAAGVNLEYSAQLQIVQSVQKNKRYLASIAPSTLGLMKIVADNNGNVISCNWDNNATSGMQNCTDSNGTVAAGAGSNANCSIAPNLPTISACPSKTTMNPASGRCIPININCFNQALGDKFDGNIFDCSTIPAQYAVRYPSSFTPPPSPPSQSSSNGGSPGPSPTPSAQCTCGSQKIAAGGNQLCVRAWNNDEGFGNYDDMFEVQRCNSSGVLEPNSPNNYVFNEEGQGVQWNFRPGYCSYSGGVKYVNGVAYTDGNCF